MTNTPQSIDHLWDPRLPCPFDDVIDVRSPAEFAEDHIPGAINLPVLNNEERARVGTIYHQESAFEARKLGAALISANISKHLSTHFARQPKDYRPFVYCWRGGLRSNSLAIVLSQIGWRVTMLSGGYKTYRNLVRQALEIVPRQFQYRLIAGATGSGKTQLLQQLARQGAQVVDLEGIANHRGSVLGGMGTQPSQKMFDSQLLHQLQTLDRHRPVWLEAESQRVGALHLPRALWEQMQASGGIEVRVPLAGRIAHLIREYAHFLADPELLKQKLRHLSAQKSPRQLSAWEQQIDARDWEQLVTSLLATHYDPGYAASNQKCFPNVTQSVSLEAVEPEQLEALARKLHERDDKALSRVEEDSPKSLPSSARLTAIESPTACVVENNRPIDNR